MAASGEAVTSSDQTVPSTEQVQAAALDSKPPEPSTEQVQTSALDSKSLSTDQVQTSGLDSKSLVSSADQAKASASDSKSPAPSTNQAQTSALDSKSPVPPADQAQTSGVDSKSPVPSTDQASLPLKCPVCGNVFMPDSNFCRKCGARRVHQEIHPQVESSVRTVKNQTCMQIVSGTSYAMGLAWKSATLSVSNPKNAFGDPSDITDSDSAVVAGVWGGTAVMIIIFVGIIAFLLRYDGKLEDRAKEAHRNHREVDYLWIKARQQSIADIINWGLTFAIANQIDLACACTIPKDPVYWRILYGVFVIFVLSVLVFCLRHCFVFKYIARVSPTHEATTDAGDAQQKADRTYLGRKVANALLGGSVYVVALATIAVIDALLGIDDSVTTSEDVAYLAIYTSISICVCQVILFIIHYFESKDTKKYDADGHESFTQIARKLVGKTVSMIAVMAGYALIYVIIAKHLATDVNSVYDPLPMKDASILFGVSVALAVIFGMVFKLLAVAAAARIKKLKAVDREYIPGHMDEKVLDFLQLFVKTSSSTFLESFSWLVGCSFNALGGAVWTEVIKEGTTDVASALSSLGFALFLTFVAVLAAFNCQTKTA